jgi:hypothetical protein
MYPTITMSTHHYYVSQPYHKLCKRDLSYIIVYPLYYILYLQCATPLNVRYVLCADPEDI